jgi:hypothetical protein
MQPSAEKGIANVFMWAIGCVVGGILLSVMLVPAGLKAMAESKGQNMTGAVFVVLGPMLFVIGLVLAAIGLFAGFQFGKAEGSARRIVPVQIRSRFAVNEIGEMIFGNFEYDAPGGQLFVQVMFSDGHVEELRTAWGIFTVCGEGMRGTAAIQGDWLASFAPDVPVPASGDPYRPPTG